MAQNIRNRTAITDPRILGLIQECVTNTEKMGFAIPAELRFLERKKAIRVAGTTYGRQKIIALSSFIFKETDDAIRSVIYHELGHIVAGVVAKHGPLWKKVVRKMTQVTGIKISRTYNEADMPVHALEKQNLWKHVFRCKGCGALIHYTKESKFCKTFDEILPSGNPRWTCRRCNNTFERVK